MIIRRRKKEEGRRKWKSVRDSHQLLKEGVYRVDGKDTSVTKRSECHSHNLISEICERITQKASSIKSSLR